MKRIVSLVSVLFLLVCAAPLAVSGQSIGATSGEISVYNESGFDVTIYISSSERGVLEAGYSKTYRVPLGAHRVKARTDARYGKQGHADFNITGTYPYDSWYIHNGDLN